MLAIKLSKHLVISRVESLTHLSCVGTTSSFNDVVLFEGIVNNEPSSERAV